MSRNVVAGLVLACGVAGCAGAHIDRALGLKFVAAPPALLAKCRATARAVGYAVPCPMRVPAGLTMSELRGAKPTCLDVISPGGTGGCDQSWRGWVVGSSYAGREHLMLTASPMRLTDYAKLVNGPAWFPGQRVRRLATVEIDGVPMSSFYVSPLTNDGSAFMQHVVLAWSRDGHTYGIGFHNTRRIHRALLWDEELVRHIRLVGPGKAHAAR